MSIHVFLSMGIYQSNSIALCPDLKGPGTDFSPKLHHQRNGNASRTSDGQHTMTASRALGMLGGQAWSEHESPTPWVGRVTLHSLEPPKSQACWQPFPGMINRPAARSHVGHENKLAVLVIKWSAQIHHDLLCGLFPTCQGNVGHFLQLSQKVRARTQAGHSKYRTEHKLAVENSSPGFSHTEKRKEEGGWSWDGGLSSDAHRDLPQLPTVPSLCGSLSTTFLHSWRK